MSDQPTRPAIRPPFVTQDVLRLACISRDTLSRWVKQGKFPAPFRLGHRLLWSAELVERHLAARQAEAIANG